MLPIDLYRRRRLRQNGSPCDAGMIVLIQTIRQQQIVTHACERAQAAGVRAGTPLSVARAALTPGALTVECHEPAKTARSLRALALWCHRFSPVVGIEDAEGVCIDITGCAHLLGGEARMGEHVRDEFQQRGVRAITAVAPTPLAARAVARCAGHTAVVVTEGGLRQAVSGLPVGALGLDPGSVAALAEVNVRRIGELLAIPRPAIAARFGDTALNAVDRLLGRAPESVRALRQVEPLWVERGFDGPCSSPEGIGQTCRAMLDRLCTVLATRDAGLVEWSVMLDRSDLDPLTIGVRHCAPSRDPRHLWGLLAPRLERANLGFGVDRVVIAAGRTGRLKQHQGAWWDASTSDADGAAASQALTDILVNRLGPDAVLRTELHQSHIPERASVLQSVLHAPREARPEGDPTQHCVGDRPTELFSTPAPTRVIALSPDGPVSRFEWLGKAHHVVACTGPERIAGEWWRAERLLRDYFKVQDQHGRWHWMFRDQTSGAWFMHGVWT